MSPITCNPDVFVPPVTVTVSMTVVVVIEVAVVLVLVLVLVVLVLVVDVVVASGSQPVSPIGHTMHLGHSPSTLP